MSLDKKIFISFFCVALLPFFILLYITYEKNIKLSQEKIVSLHEKNLEQTIALIKEDIKALEKETGFMASLNLMDDIVSEDTDKRILELITLKKRVLKFPTHISVIDENTQCTASTNRCAFTEHGFVFSANINLSFQEDKKIGELFVSLPYESLRYYFHEYANQWCLSKRGKDYLNSCRMDKGYLISKFLDKELKVSFLINKKEYEAPLYLLHKQLLYVYIFSFVSFVTLFFFVSRALSKPIAHNEKLIKQKLELQENTLILLEEAKHAAQTKARFLSQVSHDFRTPLNSIIGFSQFLDQENLVDKDYEKLPRNIEKSGKHLLEMVNKLLEFSRSENEHMALEIKEIDLCILMQELLDIMMPLAQKKSLNLEGYCEKVRVYSDEASLKNIILNLLANAIKFTKYGYVQLSIYSREDEIIISVKDSGIGIKEEEIELLFKPFSRLKNSKNTEGSGLGLALCLAYAKRLNARLSYTPHAQGSEFILKMKREIV